METNEADGSDAPARPGLPWTALRVLALSAALIATLCLTGIARLPEGGAYSRLEHDHDELMVSSTGPADRTITVLFVGNSLTFRNDLPAMLVNLASSDPGAPAPLQVKAVTYPDANLEDMRTRTGALAWAQAHHADYVVLQAHSLWYVDNYAFTLRAAAAWTEALRPLGETPLLFQVWGDGDGDGSAAYTDKQAPTFGWTPVDAARGALDSTQNLARSLGLQVVPVGLAFEAARETKGAPDVWGPDRHHPSVAGTYLAALVFYHFLTGRTGAEATYRPIGVSVRDAATLVQLNAG